MAWGVIRWLMLVAMLLPVAMAHGQCEPLPLPYSTDLITGFHTPRVSSSSFTGWSLGANWDNCWLGYLWKAEEETNTIICSGNFGVGGSWPTHAYYCNIAVSDSMHRAVAMLVAPEVEDGLASINLTLQLLKECHINQSVCTNYCAYIDYGWVRDAGHPMESFDMQGTLCIYTRDGNGIYEHNLSADWPHYCFPVMDTLPAGSRFALRMRSELQAWPHPNGVYESGWPYTFCFKEFTASNTFCNPALTSDTVYLADSVCQHSTYSRYGIALSAGQTVDTGLQTFTMRDFEYLDNGNCHEHVRLLSLRVLPSDISIVADSIFPGEAYSFFGRELTLAGGYVEDWGVNAYGCPIKDSLELSIRQLPPMECDAAIGVEQTEWYISQPATVHLWAEQEEGSYRWGPPELFGDDTSRDVYFQLPPDSQQLVELSVERLDTVNHIYRAAELDTVTDTLRLQVPVEPQTRYRLEMTLGDGADVAVQVYVRETLLFNSVAPAGRLSVDFYNYQHRECSLTVVATQAVHMRDASLRRHCQASDLVLIVSHSARPVIAADRASVCEGDTLHLTAEQTDYYVWSSQPTDTALDAQQGQRVVAVSPRETTTYYLMGPGGGMADSLTVSVERLPQLRIVVEPEVVDFDNPVLMLEERSEEIAVSMWVFSDGFEAVGRKVRHVLSVSSMDSVRVTATGCTERGCCNDTTLAFAVEVSAVWFPNVFTPDAEENNRFGMVVTQEVELLEMQIYNRNGLLVWSIDSNGDGWDGRDLHGGVCPQGAYTYTCLYRLANGFTKRQTGTVLLLR